jgi:hypothetical protein
MIFAPTEIVSTRSAKSAIRQAKKRSERTTSEMKAPIPRGHFHAPRVARR